MQCSIFLEASVPDCGQETATRLVDLLLACKFFILGWMENELNLRPRPAEVAASVGRVGELCAGELFLAAVRDTSCLTSYMHIFV